MYLPPIESNCNYEPFVSGDVSIAPDAAIAPGVIIQAGPDGRVVIASGVCIGMGAILHAYEGAIEIEEGVTIGAGVLVVGEAKIAARACIGALTTVVNAGIPAQEIVAAGSILGDRSRQVSENSAAVCTPTNEGEGTVCGIGGRTGAIDTEEQSEALAPATRGNTFIEPKPISIPETGTPIIEFELETTAPNNNAEEEPETTEAKFQYPSSGSGFATSIQPKPISIPETGTPIVEFELETTAPNNNTEEEPETTEGNFQYPSSGSGFATSIQPKPISIPETGTPVTNLEEEATAPNNNTEEEPETTEGKFQYPSSGSGFATSIQPKPISIPEPSANSNNGAIVPAAEAEASESEEEEEKPEAANNKPPVAGLDYVQSMMKTLFPHKNISLSSQDDED